jgi:hypothetical protein
MAVGGQHHALAALSPGKRPGTHCTGSWVGPGPVWMGVENLAPTGVVHVQYKFYIILQYTPPFLVLQQQFLQLTFTKDSQDSVVSIVSKQ